MKKIAYFFVIFLMGVCILAGENQVEAATTLAVKVGKTVNVEKQNVSYRISDEEIAYVDQSGNVYGKKAGTTELTMKSGSKKTKVKVIVKPNQKKPRLKACVGEVELASPVIAVEQDELGTFYYRASIGITNLSYNDIAKVKLEAEIDGKSVVFESGRINSGDEEVVEVSVAIDAAQLAAAQLDDTQPEVSKKRLYVYTNKMVQSYEYETGKLKYEYATEDTTAPKLEGFLGKNSYNDKIPYRVIYSDDKKFDYFKYVKATDDRDTRVALDVDTSKVNFKKNGTYTITYIAEDQAGNVTKKTAKLGVRVVNSLDKRCSSILKRITKKSWSDTRKATAIYQYIRSHMAYVGYSDKSSWEKAAMNGFDYGRGDCFTYYAMSRALLTRAGIPNIQMNRVKGHGRHWWNLVYVENGFYHFDVTPRVAGGKFCLVTDSQIKAYSRRHGNSHIWAYDKKPKSSKKIISKI